MWKDEDPYQLKIALEPESAALEIQDYFSKFPADLGNEIQFTGLKKGCVNVVSLIRVRDFLCFFELKN